MRVTLKLATSLDGKIATASGESRWITGDAARHAAHRLRAGHAAILVGVETVIADDPELTVRLPGFTGRQPTRVVLDSRQRTPMSSKLVASADEVATVVICASNPQLRLTQAGVTVIEVDDVDGRVDVRAAVAALDEARLTPLMVEGGGQVAASFLQAGLVDALEWFRGPIVLGEEGRPAVAGLALDDLAAAPRFRRLSVETLGEDLWERYERV
jgi:diaminohydroxyphosphoribosylaminopyrimidine deaminase/5-amino-6-(5-phosphoribosylamino)uracil reductase